MGLFSRKAQSAPEKKEHPGGAVHFIAGGQWQRPKKLREYAAEGYGWNPVIRKAIDEVATACAGLKIGVYRGDDPVDDHPALAALQKPNPVMGAASFIEQVIVNKELFDEVAIARAGDELWPMSPMHIEVMPGAGGIARAYRYGTGAAQRTFEVDRVTGQSDLFFMHGYNPEEYWRGLPPLQSAAVWADLHNNGARWNASLLKNSARPSGVFTIKGGMMQDAFDRLKEWVDRTMTGPDNAGKPGILEGDGAGWISMSQSARDMDFSASMKEAKMLISSVFGVPLPLIDNDASTFNNYRAAMERFYTDKVIPTMQEFLDAFGSWYLEEGERFVIDLDAIPALEEVRERKFNRLLKAVQMKAITVDEFRVETGWEPMGGPSAVLDPFDGVADLGEDDAAKAALMAYGRG